MTAPDFTGRPHTVEAALDTLMSIATHGAADTNLDDLAEWAIGTRRALLGYRTWTVLIGAPAPLWSINDGHRAGPHKASANRKLWRHAAYDTARRHNLPRGLDRTRITLTFHFTTKSNRDSLNYADTAKGIIDGWGPPFLQRPTAKKPKGASAPGWLMFPDDGPTYLDPTLLTIGPLWKTVVAAAPADQRQALQSQYGGVTAIITDMAGTRTPPPTPKPALFRGLT